ncbi:cytidine deaminase-like protein [Apiosordaria backusii]|uniref:Cytidine deaminase-like protein n=1 Tax=Apiosordaria backusii TaxID=314023 RepID=A0AA40DUE4_9PEZI|nr:cytidine deaminase-like protein [Apiosordaria backusii]
MIFRPAWHLTPHKHRTRNITKMTTHPTIAANDHKAYMRYAIEQARLSPPASSKFCVGAVLVDADKNEILSTGYSTELLGDRPNDPGSTYAEHCCFIKVADENGIPDFDIAKVLPPNTVLYTTMEPCNERLSGNRTCVERILGLGNMIKVVYVGIREPNTFIQDNQGIKRLEGAGIKVVLLEDDEIFREEILGVTFAGHEKRG